MYDHDKELVDHFINHIYIYIYIYIYPHTLGQAWSRAENAYVQPGLPSVTLTWRKRKWKKGVLLDFQAFPKKVEIP